MSGPLEGIRVIEVCRVAPGWFCTMMLADMGAEVIRIDMPARAKAAKDGDLTSAKSARAVAADFLNRNKKSLTLNLKDPDAQEALRRLADTADVLVEGFRPGVMERLGGDYETLAERNPRLVYCSLSGFGQDGPYRDVPAHDLNYISLAGIQRLLGGADGVPSIPLNIVGDYAGATMHGVVGVMMALFARERTGRGQHVDVSYLDTSIALLSAVPSMWGYFRDGEEPRADGGVFSGGYPYYTTYPAADGEVSIGCMEPWLWHNLCDAIERPDLKDLAFAMDHFNEPADERQTQARKELADLFKTKTRAEWFELLSRADVCVGGLNEVGEVFDDPQVRHRGMLQEREHPVAGTIRQPGIPVKLSDTPGSIRSFPPTRGEHTEELLRSLGYSADEIETLRGKGVV